MFTLLYGLHCSSYRGNYLSAENAITRCVLNCFEIFPQCVEDMFWNMEDAVQVLKSSHKFHRLGRCKILRLEKMELHQRNHAEDHAYILCVCVCDRLISYIQISSCKTNMIIKCAYCIAASRYYRFVLLLLLSIISSCWTESCHLWRDSNTSRWKHWICPSQKPGSKALVGEARIRLGTIKTSSEVVYLERRSVLKLSVMQRFASPCGTFLSNIGISGHSCIGTTLMAPHHTNSNDFDQVSHPSP